MNGCAATTFLSVRRERTACLPRRLVRVGCLSANRGFVSGKDLRLLAQRADIDAEDRHELLLLTVNRLKVSPQTIINLRRDGLLDF